MDVILAEIPTVPGCCDYLTLSPPVFERSWRVVVQLGKLVGRRWIHEDSPWNQRMQHDSLVALRSSNCLSHNQHQCLLQADVSPFLNVWNAWTLLVLMISVNCNTSSLLKEVHVAAGLITLQLYPTYMIIFRGMLYICL